MRRLNRAASEALQSLGDAVHAVTDVTGYGLAGHGWEMAERSGVRVVVDTVGHRAPIPARCDGSRARRAHRRRPAQPRLRRRRTSTRPPPPVREALCIDPQTSGGLLAAVDPTAAVLIADRRAMVVAGRRESRPARRGWCCVASPR